MYKYRFERSIPFSLLLDDWYTWLEKNDIKVISCNMQAACNGNIKVVEVMTNEYIQLYNFYLTQVAGLGITDFEIMN